MSIYIQMPSKWMEIKRGKKSTSVPALVISPVVSFYDVSFEKMRSKDRHRNIVTPRQMAMYMMRHFTDLSLEKIGEIFGDRDHTTIIHAINTINDLCETDREIFNQRELLYDKINMNI